MYVSVRELVPLEPPHTACTGVSLTVKTVLLARAPVARPLTSPSKFTVSVIVSPALLPAVPATVLNATDGAAPPSVAAVVSTLKFALSATKVWVSVASLPAASRIESPPVRLSPLAARLMPVASVCPA